jgi:predicted Zn-dependent protease
MMRPPGRPGGRASQTGGALLLAAAAGGCVQSHYSLATQRQEYTLTSTAQEIATGRKLARRVEEELPPVADEALQRRIDGLGQRIARVCDRQELLYRFVALEGDEVNAFALPGGHVYVYQGLIDLAETDAAVAGVLAHEVAHIAARHSVKRFEAGLGAQLVQLATILVKDARAARGVGIGLQTAQLSYARQDELEADRLGVSYLRKAGIEPAGLLEFLERLREVERRKLQPLPRGVVRPLYARTHPFIPERVRGIKEALYGSADYLDYLNTPD